MKKNFPLLLSWLFALFATMMSIFFGEILEYEPCALCWYQRICLFPLVLVLAVGIYRQDRMSALYVIPQVIVGMCIALYQFIYPIILPYLGIVPVCTFGKDCTTSPFEFFGFINLPFLGLLSFLILLILLLLALFKETDQLD